MSPKRKKPRSQSSYNRQVLAIIDRYIAETGDKNPDYHTVAAWAYRLELIEPPPYSVVKQIARSMARASRDDYITDDNGEPVRRRMNFTEQRGDKQMAFWFKMEDATPEKMRLSAMRRRNGTLMDVLQLHRDIKYFNAKHNPGDPLLFDANFNPDIEEREQPPEYPEGPANDDQG
jgi:hypothetical protein